VASETILNDTNKVKNPNEIFYGISDDFWIWLNTEGVRRNEAVANILPGLPDATTQKNFTSNSGDTTLIDAFDFYKFCKQQYSIHCGDISQVTNILDFGCGWDRIVRFFIKDLPPSKIWGCDPIDEMIILLCRAQNKWCNFETISSVPPTGFQDNTFDLIYSYSVFSHLSEDFHLNLLSEIKRILKPGGIYITRTRNRQFILDCAKWRPESNGQNLNSDTEGSSQAF
jgi:SAM-dependent methyltransferase